MEKYKDFPDGRVLEKIRIGWDVGPSAQDERMCRILTTFISELPLLLMYLLMYSDV
jgi:hypothetical protein